MKFVKTMGAAALIASMATASFAQEGCVTEAEKAALSEELAATAVLCVVDAGGPGALGGAVAGGAALALLAASLSSSSSTPTGDN